MAGTVFKKLPDLRVVDLRSELEKRGLDRSGNKAALLSRLQQALIGEGRDPDMYMFEVDEVPGSKKKKPRKDKDGDSQEGEEEDEEEVESEMSFKLDSCKESADSDETLDSGDASVVKVPNPETIEPNCPLTVENTFSVQESNQKVGEESLSFFVNADESWAETQPGEEIASLFDKNRTISDTDKEETVNGAISQAEEQPTEENKPTTVGEKSLEESTESIIEAELPSYDENTSDMQQREPIDKGSANPDVKPVLTSTGVSLWVSGLGSTTRAADLKALFSKCGRVAIAKIIASTKAPGSRCYGFVTMSSPDEASKCIQHLHRTELHGRMISVERAKNDQFVSTKKVAAPKTEAAVKPEEKLAHAPEMPKVTEIKVEKKDDETGQSGEAALRKDKEVLAKSHEKTEKSKSKESYPVRRHHGSRSRSKRYSQTCASQQALTRLISHHTRPTRVFLRRPYRRGAPPYRSSRYFLARSRAFDIRRDRESEMLERMRQREKEHKQREEMLRIEREKERLRAERERLEREKLELHQQQMRMAYERMPPPSLVSMKRSYDASYPEPKRYVSGYSSRSSKGRSPGRRDSYKERRSSDRYERDFRSDHSFNSRREGDRRDTAYRLRDEGRSSLRDDRRMLSPRRGREMQLTSSPRVASSWGSSGSSRHMSNTTGNRERADYPVRGSYPSGHSSITWPGEGNMTAANSGGSWARPASYYPVGSSSTWNPSTVFSSVTSGSSTSYSGGGDRFDAYKYSASISRRY